MRRPVAFTLLSFCFSSITFASESIVEVTLTDRDAITLSSEQAPRLDATVMTAVDYYQTSSMDIDWLQSKLFDLDKPLYLKNVAVRSINRQKSVAKHQDIERWKTLRRQIEEWQFSKRVLTPLDPDVTRVNASQNPRLRGQYQLFLKPISKDLTVTVLGNVKQPRELAWYPRRSANQYLNKTQVENQSLSYVWVIQPDGAAFQYPVAYWNYQFHNIAPGAFIYVPMPLSRNLDDELTRYKFTNKDTNQLIIELLTHKLPL
ncbi:MAG: hypothetical protein BM561_06240 [Vibrio sp. MedPE-SWchi]|nr:MAG: hypothetical protein BM561_06240 [Vibrio sp. MedPE-SWchi]